MGFESAEAIYNLSDSITIELLGLETSFLYFWNPCKVPNLLIVEIFMCDVTDGSGGLYTLILFYLITSARHKLSNCFLHCYNEGSVTTMRMQLFLSEGWKFLRNYNFKI